MAKDIKRDREKGLSVKPIGVEGMTPDFGTNIEDEVTIATNKLLGAKTTAEQLRNSSIAQSIPTTVGQQQADAMRRLVEVLANQPGAIDALRRRQG